MTDDNHSSDDVIDRPDDIRYARDVLKRARDALENDNPSDARELLIEARAVLERVYYDDSGQTQRESGFDCYD